MTVTEAARTIGISASNLYQLVAAPRIAHYRVGGKIVFRDDDIAAFLAGRRIATTYAGTVIGGQMWDAGKPLFDYGRAEAAALLFSGQAHVMCMKNPDGNQQNQEQEHPRVTRLSA